MKKLILLVLFLVSVTVRSQTDTTNLSFLDSLTYDQLLQYYINEKEPPQFSKGPIEIGDSSYKILNPLTVPTKTVYADPLLRYGDGDFFTGLSNELGDSTFNGQMLKPKVSLGMGRLGFHGDLYNKHFQKMVTARPAFDLSISQRLTPFLQLDFTVLFGKLGANEWLNNRQENFYSEIRAGGVNLLYDFGNLIPPRYAIRPFVSFGVMGFEYLSKTDLKDKNGNLYYYWSDGSIKDKAEGAADAQFAKELKRDYVYETDIRERNADGFGKYPERAWSFPIGVGAVMKVTERVDIKFNFQYFLTTTDYMDGITKNSIGSRAGTKGRDKFSYSSFSLQYDLIAKTQKKRNPLTDTLSNDFWLAFDKEDHDKDGVADMMDECQGTPEGVAVDLKGCPLDDDADGIPNYKDDEPATAMGVPVNEKGVGQTEEYWQKWYADYLNDSLSTNKTIEYVGNFFQKNKKPKKVKKDVYTVELARYKGAIPTEELASLLSIGDINSKTLDDGTTVVYTTGDYEKIGLAIKRRDELKAEGNKTAGLSKVTENSIEQISESEVEKLLKAEIAAEGAVASNTVQSETIKDSLSKSGGTLEEVTEYSRGNVVYRVQLGAFRNKISTSIFNTSTGVLELKTGEDIYRYVTKGYKTIEDAAAIRADLVLQGYSDAFVTAYKDGKRIALNQTKAIVDKSYVEDLNEGKIFSSVDKKLVAFKIQLGPLKKPALESMMDEKVKSLSDTDKQTTATGSIRYTSGSFGNFDAAEKYRKELEGKGFMDAFIIATFKNEIISIQEALELMK